MPKKTTKSISLEPELNHFLKWLRSKGVNTSNFTKMLWMDTPEWKEVEEKYDNIKTWIER